MAVHQARRRPSCNSLICRYRSDDILHAREAFATIRQSVKAPEVTRHCTLFGQWRQRITPSQRVLKATTDQPHSSRDQVAGTTEHRRSSGEPARHSLASPPLGLPVLPRGPLRQSPRLRGSIAFARVRNTRFLLARVHDEQAKTVAGNHGDRARGPGFTLHHHFAERLARDEKLPDEIFFVRNPPPQGFSA